MSFEYFISRRYLRTRQKQALVTLITYLSMAGITVGVMALIVVIAVLMATFTAINTGTVDIDLAFTEFTQPLALILTVTFALGWLFGLLCMGLFVIKLINERRVLRRSLRLSESEVTSLRGLPLNDAD